MAQPTTIGRYDIVSEIGRGAMGVVYDAVDPMLQRVVAIKTINMALDPEEMEHYEKRFTIEARAAGGLNHPNIVTIYDIGRSGDLAYMAMEFLDGRELKDMISANALSVDRSLDIAAQVADGLAYAHERGVVHRDIKPANIMILRDGRVKITDFGIARMKSAEVRTQTGVVLGSPRYLSPEQVLGKGADASADVFSLGVIVYEMVTGQAPFSGADVNALMYQIVNHNPTPPSAMNPAVPAMLDLILAKALAKSSAERYASIGEFAADLRACRVHIDAAGTSPEAASEPQPAGESSVVDQWMDTVPLPRIDAFGGALSGDAMPARGLAKGFDSMAATMRLAVQTGVITDPQRLEATIALIRGPGELTPPGGAGEPSVDSCTASVAAAPPWSQRDRAIFLGAVLGATALGAVIVFV